MPDQVPESVKQERSLAVRNLASENKFKFRQQFIGIPQTVLVEKSDKKGFAKGYGQHYLPVEFRAKQAGTNYFERVAIKSIASASSDFVLKGS
jgi:threonylcarbamoyladenosine tRNA methylthiotransferase MtaB